MSSTIYHIQEKTLFSESLIWQFNRDFYHQKGTVAWSDDLVPHEITNSSLAATNFAELIYAFFKDLEINAKSDEVVYILELGAGHGKLCYNILRHLDKLTSADQCSTKYCYVLSDIVEENLAFLNNHPKLKEYFEQGILDICYFDATQSQELRLRKSKKTIAHSELDRPILTIANYFFDSLPNELFHFDGKNISKCSVSIDSTLDPAGSSAQEMISHMELTFHKTPMVQPIFQNEFYNEILDQYVEIDGDSYILFPKSALECLSTISGLSKAGLVLLTMDKGYKEIIELAGRAKPDFVIHGSFSLWVNFHALSQFCLKNGGFSMFDSSTNMSIELGCLFFTKQLFKYNNLEQMYRKHTMQLNLDDFNSIKKLVYKNMAGANMSELLGLIRLSSYDATIFINLLPSIKSLSKNISVKQRSRLGQTIFQVWNKYYAVKKDYDLSYELGGLMYDLGYYNEALEYFKSSSDTFGDKIDVNYNQILCYYELRQDELFYKTLKEAKLRFPMAEVFLNLEKLDMQ